MAYRQDRPLVDCNTNNGVESQNNNLKHTYLKNHRTASMKSRKGESNDYVIRDQSKKVELSHSKSYTPCITASRTIPLRIFH